MSEMVKSIFGWKTNAQKRAEQLQQQQIRAMQTQSGRQAELDAVALARQDSASGRLARAFGKRALSYQGNDLGVGPAGLAPTLGG